MRSGRLICAAVLSLSLLLCSCGGKTKDVLNYEQPIVSMRGAINAEDEISYLCCYLPPAKADFLGSEDYRDGFLTSVFDRDDSIGGLRIRVEDSSELTPEELDLLEHEFKEKHGVRYSFTKGQRLNVKFMLSRKKSEAVGSQEIIVVRYENIWYIYGDVIDSFPFLTDGS